MPDLDLKLRHKDRSADRRVVRGLTFVSPRNKQRSFSKEILREFRLKNPSKHKRPDTDYLRRHVKSFANLKEVHSSENSQAKAGDSWGQQAR